MVVQVTIGRWGNNLAVRLPHEIVQTADLRDGERVDVATTDGAVVIRRMQSPIVLRKLFQGRSPDDWRMAYADAFDWGADVGREVVPE